MKAVDAREAAKLVALRHATAVGIEAIEQRACREFESFVKLSNYLKAATDKVIAGAATKSRTR
ncbi:hypothetical protein GCM10010909_33640 [Acidocella aquatica]|uniref:Uncharacterized protein n=1 Tax=Acidocella aquatica TaxID=1922313 RepID=A0ABQ6ABJ1_9PROT|nr:hypothetical protein [Acidocella aquatica]GLR68682.1 hypothetical protein GCM10010909_33640 [Acidocella aquatica]